MTDTEMFIEALIEKNPNGKAEKTQNKKIVLFDALTEFMKKQALSNASEIVGYYAKQYRKVAKKYALNNKEPILNSQKPFRLLIFGRNMLVS